MKLTVKQISQSVSATTFQLGGHWNPPFKSHYDMGDIVKSPFGKALITNLDPETGRCRIYVYDDKKRARLLK